MRKIMDWNGKQGLVAGIASDHGGFELKKQLIAYLAELGCGAKDFGPFELDPEDDYSDFGSKMGFAIAKGELEIGILICRSGVGMGIDANRFHAVRAAVAYNEKVVRSSREHNCSNVLVLPADHISVEEAKAFIKVWFETPFSGDARHVRRLEKLERATYDDIAAIRDADLELLFSCDCIVANFDGCDLDSGTVVEFCFAKMLDLPAVLLRTDFRTGCDQGPGGDPWNLMCSGYPRTNTVVLHGMQVFHQHYKGAEDWKNKLDSYRNDIAERVIHALDQSIAADPVFPVAVMEEQYARAAAAAGGSLPALFSRARIEELLASKMAKKIYR